MKEFCEGVMIGLAFQHALPHSTNLNHKQSPLWPPSTLFDVVADTVVLSPGPYLTHYTFFKEAIIKKDVRNLKAVHHSDRKSSRKTVVGRGKDQPKRRMTGCIVSLMDTQLFGMYPPGTPKVSQGLGIEVNTFITPLKLEVSVPISQLLFRF